MAPPKGVLLAQHRFAVTVEAGAQHLLVVGGAGQQVGTDLGQATFQAIAGDRAIWAAPSSFSS
jgi:hypothetical protein